MLGLALMVKKKHYIPMKKRFYTLFFFVATTLCVASQPLSTIAQEDGIDIEKLKKARAVPLNEAFAPKVKPQDIPEEQAEKFAKDNHAKQAYELAQYSRPSFYRLRRQLIEKALSAVPMDKRGEYQAFLESLVNIDHLTQMVADIYAEHYTATELGVLNGFAATQSGQQVFAKLPAVMDDIVAAQNKHLRRATKKLLQNPEVLSALENIDKPLQNSRPSRTENN